MNIHHEPKFQDNFLKRYREGQLVFIVHVGGFDFWHDTADKDIPIGFRRASRAGLQWMNADRRTFLSVDLDPEIKKLVFNLLSLIP